MHIIINGLAMMLKLLTYLSIPSHPPFPTRVLLVKWAPLEWMVPLVTQDRLVEGLVVAMVILLLPSVARQLILMMAVRF